MSTWDESKELAQSALDDTNFIDEVQDKYMDSVEGKLNHAKANIQDFFNTIISAGNIGTVVTGFNGVTGALNALIKTAQKLPGIGNTTAKVMTGFIGIASSGLLNSLTKANNELKQDDDLKGKYGIFDVFKKAGSTFKADFKTLGTKESVEGRENGLFSIFKNAFKDYKVNASEAVQANNQLGNSLSGLNNNWNATKSAVSATWKSMTGLSKAITVLGVAMTAIEIGKTIFNSAVKSSKEIKDNVDEINSSLHQSENNAKKFKDVIDNNGANFEELSKGVNPQTGENISLTTEQLEKYHDICNQIAEISPSLVNHYDSEGNAILNLEGNVKSLNDAYDELLVKQANAYLSGDNIKQIKKNFDNYTGERGAWTEFKDGALNQLGVIFTQGTKVKAKVGEAISNADALEVANKSLKLSYEEMVELMNKSINQGGFDLYQRSFLESLGFSKNMSKSQFSEAQLALISQQKTLEQTSESAAANMRTMMQQMLVQYTKGNSAVFKSLSETTSSEFSTFLGNTSLSFIKTLDEEENGYSNYISKVLTKLTKDKDVKRAFDSLFSIDSSASLDTLSKSINENVEKVSKAFGISEDEVAHSAGIENIYDTVQSYDKLLKKSDKYNKNLKISNKGLKDAKKTIKDFIKSKGISEKNEINLLQSMMDKYDSWRDVVSNWDLQNALNVSESSDKLDALRSKLESVKTEIELFNTAIQESNSSSGMDINTIDKLKEIYSTLGDDYNPDKLFEYTYSGLHLNSRELKREQSIYETKQAEEYNNELQKMQKNYQTLCQAIAQTGSASEKSSLIDKRDALSEQIQKLKETQSAYEGLTNSVTKWQNAQSYSLTQDIGSGYEDAKKLFDEGWIGDEKFQAYAQLFTNKNLSGSTSDVYEQVFAQNEGRMQRYFAEGRQGVNNFIQDIANTVPEAKGLIDEAGNVDWTKMPAVETLAKAMDLDKSLVDAMFKEMNRAGADLDFSEAADNLREMRDAAVDAGQSFSSLDQLDTDKKLINSDKLSQEQKDFKFDLDATGDALNDQITNAQDLRKALVKAYGEGAEQVKAFDKQLDYLLAKKGSETEQLKQDTRVDAQNAINKELNKKQKKKGIKKKDRTQMDVDWDSADASYFQSQADKLLDAISDKKGNIKIKLSDEGGEQALALLNEIQQKEWELSDSNVKVHVDTSQLNTNQQKIVEGFGNIQEAANNLQNLQNNKKRGLPVSEKEIQDAQTNLQTQINDFVAKHPKAAGKLKLSNIEGDLGDKKLSKQQKQALQKEINKYAKDVTSGTAGDYLSKMKIKKSAWQDTKKSKKKDKNTTVLTQEVKVKGKDKIDKLKKEINSIKNTDVNLNVKDSRDKDSTKTETKKPPKKETQTKTETQTRTKKAEKVVSAYNDFDDLKLSEKQQNVVVKYIADHSDIDRYTPEEKQAIAEYLAGHTDVDSWTPAQKEAVANFIAHHESVDAWTPAEKQALARYLLNSEQPDNYQPGGKDAVVTYSKNSAAVDTYNPPDIVRSVTYTIKTIGSAIKGIFGGSSLNGTAHVNGTAYANGTTGNWGAKQTETALVGEENPELRVDSRTGRWELLGQNGAEFRKINKGDIIFNARQTKDLFEHGYVNGRGKAFLNGTIDRAASLFKTSGQAYGNGTWGGGRWNIYTGASNRNPIISTASNVQQAKQAAKQSAAAAASDADKFLETMDWIEIKIKRLEDVISDLDAKASSAYRKFSDRNKTLGDEFTKVTEEIQLQKDAYNAYLQKANSIELSEDYKNKVRNGMLSIEDITDETLKDKIDEFQTWWMKVVPPLSSDRQCKIHLIAGTP